MSQIGKKYDRPYREIQYNVLDVEDNRVDITILPYGSCK